MPYRHELRVRYAEVDMQGHVFNAHYLTFVDEAFGGWLRETLGDPDDSDLEMVLKRAELTWHGPANFDDVLAIDVSVRRWGTTSFDIGYQGAVGERPVFEAVVTYISVAPGVAATGPQPIPVPDELRAALT
jgi:acyl-CoA thioester hydrolase